MSPAEGFLVQSEVSTAPWPITAHLVWLLPLLPAVMGPTGGSGGAVAAAAGDMLLTAAHSALKLEAGQSRAWTEPLHAFVRTRNLQYGT